MFFSPPPTPTTPRQSGNTPLHRAAAYGQTGAMRRLIEAGADVNCVNSEGATPLSRAARWGHADAVALLLEARADASVADAGGKRPLDWALAKGFQDVAALLKPGYSAGAGANAAAGAPSAKAAPPPSKTAVAAAAAAAAAADTAGRAAANAPAPTANRKASANAPAPAAEEDDGDLAEEGITGLGDVEEEAGEEGGDAAEEWVDGGEGEGEYYDEGQEEEGGGGGASPIRVEGWMAKQGHIFRNWKNRWFVLEARSIFYFSKEGATKARGVIQMVDGSDIVIEEKYPKPFCFTIITPRKRFVLQAADEDEMAEWLMAIQHNLECVAADEGEGDQDGGGSE